MAVARENANFAQGRPPLEDALVRTLESSRSGTFELRFLFVVVFAALSLCWHSAAAQASSPASSEPKRSDTAAASSPVALARGAAVVASPAASVAKTVAERKAETMDAARKGQLVPAGHGSPAQVH